MDDVNHLLARGVRQIAELLREEALASFAGAVDRSLTQDKDQRVLLLRRWEEENSVEHFMPKAADMLKELGRGRL